MTKKIRLAILFACAALFFIITPYIVLYSLGYRIDVKKLHIVAIGGIYVKVLPQGSTVVIDNTISNATSIFSNAVFVQNLLPTRHFVLIKKDGYYDYRKNLDVQGRSVTKLEHVLLFKKNIGFQVASKALISPFTKPIAQDAYSIKNNNLYYFDIHNNLTILQKNTPVIENMVAYKSLNNNIIWLGLDGFLYSSDLNGKNPQKLSQTNHTINQRNSYELFVFNNDIFLKENTTLLLFDASAGTFVNFYNPVSDVKISPDGQKILYINDHEILFSTLNSNNPDKVFLNRFSEKITDAYWLNNDYIILSLENKIIISEIDTRDTINTVELPQTLTLDNGNNPSAGSGQTITISNPKISFNQQDKKLYILQDANLLVSERLVP